MHTQADVTNKLLALVSPAEYRDLVAAATIVPLEKNCELAAPWQPLEFCWFPLSGIVASLASDADGEEAAVCLIGREGLIDAATILGDDVCSTRMVVQAEGSALRISHTELANRLESSPDLSRLLLAYVRFKAVQSDCIVLAALRRPLSCRLAAILLMALDRVDGDEVDITHLNLSMMLGVRRAGVTAALTALVRAGAIKTGRHQVRILERELLRVAAGSAYGDAEDAYERLVGRRLRIN